MIWRGADAEQALPGATDLASALALLAQRQAEGTVVRAMPGRVTFHYSVAGVRYFAKVHTGVGWAEIIKNLLSLRLPVLGARNEFRAAQQLAAAGVTTLEPVLFGSSGAGNPARQRSFLVTRAVVHDTDLEQVALAWQQAPAPAAQRRALIRAVAQVARRMHSAGINHRDFYLCHFLLAGTPAGLAALPLDQACAALTLIDLHRAQCRTKVPLRWQVKDLGGLWFSALAAGLSRTDRMRFVAGYTGLPPADALRRQSGLWAAVGRRARRLQREGLRKGLPGVPP